MIVNIPKDNLDQFFRYKRETIDTRLITKQGGLTEIVNLESIGKQIYREPKSIVKFLKKRLNCNITKSETGYRIPGVVSKDTIDDHLEIYITQEVLCSVCDNPETEITKKGKRKCKACGYSN